MTEDRRVERTKKYLQDALIDLIMEKGYDAVTIQDITERANVGRSTFYSHYQSKEDLFIATHGNQASTLDLGTFSREELLGHTPPDALLQFLKEMRADPNMYHYIMQGKDGSLLAERIHRSITEKLLHSFQHNFADSPCSMPLPALANYLSGAQITLVRWWMENRNDCTPEQIAGMIQRLRRDNIRLAFGL